MNYWPSRENGTQDTPFMGDVLPFRLGVRSKPLKIAAVVLDWDGTVQQSYETLRAVAYLKKVIAAHSSIETAARFLSELVQARSFQGVLHQGKPTLRFFEAFVRDNKLPISRKTVAAAVEKAREIQKRAIEVDPGLTAFQRAMAIAGTEVPIYTNSPPVPIFQKMRKANVDPIFFGQIYARDNGGTEFQPITIGTHWQQAKAFVKRLVPYRDFKKPSAAPLEKLARDLGINMDQILVVGEGKNDLEIVWGDPKNPKGHFAFHAAGAKAIDQVVWEINEELRPGAEPLGYRAVMDRVKEKGIPPKSMMVLNNGLADLVAMSRRGEIEFVAPPRHRQTEGQLVRSYQPSFASAHL